MEIPPPARSFADDAGRKATHDFLSLYTATGGQTQDPRPSPGNFLKTQNFLQPLERIETTGVKEGNPAAISPKDRSHLPAHSYSAPTSVEHTLPGGIGTYTISHISFTNQACRPEASSLFIAAHASSTERNADNSNSSSQTGSGFTLWDESAVHKRKKGRENVVDRRSIVREPASELRQCAADRSSQSSFNQQSSFAPASSSQVAAQTNRSLMDLIVSTKSIRDDDEDCEVDFVIKKEGPPPEKGDFKIRTEGKNAERKAGTPRSKHSATEQRRRSKINDRFLMLREIIPNSDQKKDKASFLLETIQYIQNLQEKVHRYEAAFPGWNHESSKKMHLESHRQPTEGSYDHSPLFSAKFPDKKFQASAISKIVQKKGNPVTTNPLAFKMNDQLYVPTNKIVIRPIPSQQKLFAGSGGVDQYPPKLVTELEATTPQHPQQGDGGQFTATHAILHDEVKGQEMGIEGGSINISSTYSQGFLNTLTQALQSLGVDLSQSRISVQIELGKQNNLNLGSTATVRKVDVMNSTSQVKETNTLLRSGGQSDSDQDAKRQKTGNH